MIEEVITTAKNSYYNNLISQADNKQKVTWNIMLTNKKASNDNDPTNVDGKLSTSIAKNF
jgi:ribosomal protein L28